jgi:heme A synthase
MTPKTPVYQRLMAGVGGVLMIVSLFLPWAGVNGTDQDAWKFNTVAALYFLICGVLGIATAITGGRYGLFRPDVSLIGATDLLNVIAILLAAWLLVDFPDDATRQPGVYCALVLAAVISFPIADYRPLRGGPWFPPADTSEPEPIRPTTPR